MAEGSGGEAADQQRLVERISDGYLALDSDWCISDCNEYARETIAAVRDEEYDSVALIGQNLWDIISDSEDTIYHRQFHEVAREGRPVEFETKFPALNEWFEVRVYPDSDGVSVFFTSIADEKHRAQAIQTRSEVLRDLYEVFHDSEVAFDSKIQTLLQIGRRVLGTEFGSLSHVDGTSYTFEVVDAPEDTISAGDTVDLTWTNCERVVVSEERLVLSDIVTEAPELAERKANQSFGLSCYIGTPVHADDEVYGTLCFYDRTPREEPFTEWETTLIDVMGTWASYELQRRRVEGRLRTQRENLRQLHSVLSHDLRNPLTVAKGYTEMARESGDLEELDIVETTLERMVSIIDDVLEVAELDPESLSLQSAETATLAEAAWEMVPTEDAEIRVTATNTIGVDKDRLQRVFENLFSNAVSHNEDPVSIEVGDLDGGFYVADTGTGIGDDVAEDAFEPGVSTSSNTGLGLAIVKEISEAHGWSYTITESMVGGARFEFTDVAVE